MTDDEQEPLLEDIFTWGDEINGVMVDGIREEAQSEQKPAQPEMRPAE